MEALPHALLDWWFAPWRHARLASSPLLLVGDEFGLRDGYRLWCARAGIEADLPASFDPAWSVAVSHDGEHLIGAARLFAGMHGAREHDMTILHALPQADRKWCLSVAATQPLAGCCGVPYGSEHPIEVRGLVELARRLEHGFPGMWTRLRLMLPDDLSKSVDHLRRHADTPPARQDAAAIRAQRCWRLCAQRAESGARLAAA